ncbi:hypothetical protein T265_15406, partial [Opisthorchis viverrini]
MLFESRRLKQDASGWRRGVKDVLYLSIGSNHFPSANSLFSVRHYVQIIQYFFLLFEDEDDVVGTFQIDKLSSYLNTSERKKTFAAELSIRQMPTDRLQTIEQGSKTLICILVTKPGHRSSPERVFLEIHCLQSFVGQIKANVTKWPREFRNRIPLFNRHKAKFYEQHILIACLPIGSIAVTHLHPLKLVRMPSIFIYLRQVGFG